jgi:hypothetical protein
VREIETGEETEGDRLQKKKKKEDERGEELLLHQEDNSMAQEVPREESKFGGLLHPAGSDRVVFKVPQERKSILGLDALARAKRAAAADAEKGGGGGAWKRPHVVSVAAGEDEYGDKHGGTEVGNEEDEDDDRSDTRPAYGARKYRAARPDDTPSHHGGVNAEVVGAIVERTRQRRITGVSFVCVCVCFSVSLSSLYHYLCLSCRCHAVHNKQEYS